MPTKDLDTRTGRYTVAFRLPPEAGAEQAWLAGDFNGWSTDDCPMHREADGGMLAVVEDLEPGTELRFRYYLGDGAWENDWAADAYVDNEFGGADSLLVLPAVESPPPDVKAPGAEGNGHGHGGSSPIQDAAEAAPVVQAIVEGAAGAPGVPASPDPAMGGEDDVIGPATPVMPELAPAATNPSPAKKAAKKAAAAKKPAKKAAAKKKAPAKKATPKAVEPPPGTDSA